MQGARAMRYLNGPFSRSKQFIFIYLTLGLLLCAQLYQYSAGGKYLLVFEKGNDARAFDVNASHVRTAVIDDDCKESKPLPQKEQRFASEHEAEHIIRTAYEQSYAHILPCDNSTIEENCMKKTLNFFNPTTEDERQALPSIPWWFQTLLRDVNINGAYGFWHHFSTTDPAMKFCTIEKVGTTEWRRVFCDLNAEECQSDGEENYPGHCIQALPGRHCALKTNKPVPSDAPQAVFLRDPLERLLSGFIDKCVREFRRTSERHCEPNEIFNTGQNGWNDKKDNPTIDFEKNPKQFFSAFLDIMPLKWNLHFVPQAMYCDLYRKIGTDFAFVGNMGKEFLTDVERLAKQLGGRFPTQLNKTFEYATAIEAKHSNTGKNNDHATHSPEKVALYYNAASVRKALMLYSIDYVTLGLEVPEWAKAMLRNETP